MAIPQGISDNLTKNYPKLINEKVEKVLDILDKINEGVRKINEIDFCNPLGYILSKISNTFSTFSFISLG